MTGHRAILAGVIAIVLGGCAGASHDSAPTSAVGSQGVAVSAPTPPAPTTSQTMTPVATARPTVTPTPSPRPSPQPTPAALPDLPTGVVFSERWRQVDVDTAVLAHKVTWRAPLSDDVEIRVYGVTRCVEFPVPFPTEPRTAECLLKGTRLPASVRTLLASAPASDGVARWKYRTQSDTWACHGGYESIDRGDEERDGGGGAYAVGPGYYSVVVGAYNDQGHSIFAIAEPGWWDTGDPGC